MMIRAPPTVDRPKERNSISWGDTLMKTARMRSTPITSVRSTARAKTIPAAAAGERRGGRRLAEPHLAPLAGFDPRGHGQRPRPDRREDQHQPGERDLVPDQDTRR